MQGQLRLSSHLGILVCWSETLRFHLITIKTFNNLVFASGGATVNEVRSFPGSASGHGSPSHTSEVNSGRLVHISSNLFKVKKKMHWKFSFGDWETTHSSWHVNQLHFMLHIVKNLLCISACYRINKKRPYSWSRHSGSSLEPVDEEHPFNHTDPNFKLSKLSEHGKYSNPFLLPG